MTPAGSCRRHKFVVLGPESTFSLRSSTTFSADEQKKPLPSWSRSSTSSTSTSPSEIKFMRERGCSKLAVFCIVFTVLMIGLGCAAGIYFGFLSDHLHGLRADELRVFRGQLRLTSGDSYSDQLADPSTAEYVRKARFYRTKLDSIFKHSIFKAAFAGTEILGLDGHPEEDLIVHFNVRLDTRKIPVDAGDLYIILAEELRQGRVLSQYEIDHDSLMIQERVGVMESLPPDPPAEEPTTPRPAELAEPATPQPRQCEPLEVSFCAHMPYNMTSYPNVLGHVDLREIDEHLISFREVVDSECFRLAHDFVCQLLQPACLSDQLVLPCRDFCHDFYSQCNARLPSQFADRLLCDNFPARGEQQCLSRPGCVRELELAGRADRVCDGVVDCPDASDEAACPACPPGLVRCAGERSCVPAAALCDGQADCALAGDERGCLSLDAAEPTTDAARPGSVQGFLTYNGWGRQHYICAGTTNETAGADTVPAGPLANLSTACALLSYRKTELVESRPVAEEEEGEDETANSTAAFVQLRGLSQGASTFQPADCPSEQGVFVRCSELECGLAPGQTPLQKKRTAPAAAADFPWQARLVRDGHHLCDATLIHNQWLVSAADCFKGRPRTRWRAVLGSARSGSSPPHLQRRRISGMVRSPVKGSGVTLLRLARPTEDSDQVRPVCAAETGAAEGGPLGPCFTLGWNSTDGQLRYVPLTVNLSRPDSSNETEPVTVTAVSPRTDHLCQSAELPGAPLLCRSGSGVWRLVGVSGRQQCARPAAPAPARAFDTLAANQYWMETSMASFKDTEPLPAVEAEA
ncbi:atrial natriuretic peptide-converting enzyme-like isoform X2 [Amphibalanus amphitrite]|nr:atrial natriuretic peptide-converting enzyme-like isoform X2 [Amphibalanus amphitrite]